MSVTIIFILLCYGICNIMIYSSIFEGWRNFLVKFGTGGYSLHKLFTCFMCLSTWVGFTTSLILNYSGFSIATPMGCIGVTNLLLMTIFNGFIASGGVWILHNIEEMFERAFSSIEE